MHDNFLRSKDIAIIAYGETRLERRSGKSPYELASQVAAELLGKTNLTPKDIDGLGTTSTLSDCTNPFYSNFCADYLGITPRWLAISGYALALLVLVGSYYISWSFFVFPAWVALVSIFILVDNFRPRPALAE